MLTIEDRIIFLYISSVKQSTVVMRLHNPIVTFSFGEAFVSRQTIRDLLQLCITDRLNLLYYGPFDAFGARWRGEGSIVAPISRHVYSLHEVVQCSVDHILRVFLVVLGFDRIEEGLKESVFFGASFLSIEKDADNCAVRFWRDAFVHMNEMNLSVVELTVDAVLTWRVQVELLGSELLHRSVTKSDRQLSFLSLSVHVGDLSSPCHIVHRENGV